MLAILVIAMFVDRDRKGAAASNISSLRNNLVLFSVRSAYGAHTIMMKWLEHKVDIWTYEYVGVSYEYTFKVQS
jgi:hypothetical protein